MKRRDNILLDLVNVLISGGFLLSLSIIKWPLSLHQVLGTMCGAAAGIVASVHHNRNWDWLQRRRRDSYKSITASESVGCLIPLMTAAGVLAAKYGLVETLLGAIISEFFMFFVLTGFALLFTYMGIQEWHYAKRDNSQQLHNSKASESDL